VILHDAAAAAAADDDDDMVARRRKGGTLGSRGRQIRGSLNETPPVGSRGGADEKS